MVHLLERPATPSQMADMHEVFGTYVKLAVDIERGIAAGGGALDADCEGVLLDSGSEQRDVWGADWVLASREVRFEALINLRPAQNNPSVEIIDPMIQERVASVVRYLMSAV